MENPQKIVRLSQQLCHQIFTCELQIEIGNINENLICKTIELYVEAMSVYMDYSSRFNTLSLITASTRGYQYYQEKVKRLLVRKDVQKCLLGFKTNPKAINLEIQLNKVNESAPQQAKALIEHFKKFHVEQEKLIKKTVTEQNNRLQERIAKRSRSRSNSEINKDKQNFLLLIQ